MANDNWETPQYIFDWLDKEFKFNIDAACIRQNCKCGLGFMVDEGFDALNIEWENSLNYYLNPPYSNPYPWVKKAYEESLRGCVVVCLLPADISTKWFHEWVINKAEIRFIQGRINFDNPIHGKYNSPKFGSMIAIYGTDVTPKVISVKRPDRPRKTL